MSVAGCRGELADAGECGRLSGSVDGHRLFSPDVIGRRRALVSVTVCRWASPVVSEYWQASPLFTGRRRVMAGICAGECRRASPLFTGFHWVWQGVSECG